MAEAEINPWLKRRVLLFAHRGGAKEAPSSTLAAITEALRAGAHAIELDVHVSADGQLVCSHDDTVDRTTEGTGRIAEMTLEELERLDAAFWWVPGAEADHNRPPGDYPYRGRAKWDPAFRIPTLKAVLEASRGAILNLDIKEHPPQAPAYEDLLADELRQFGRSDDVIVASFDEESIKRFRKLAPEVATAASFAETLRLLQMGWDGLGAWEGRIVALQIPYSLGKTKVVDGQLVERIHELGLACHVWVVDEEDEIVELVQAGVDGVMSDAPRCARRVLDRLGVAWASRPEDP